MIENAKTNADQLARVMPMVQGVFLKTVEGQVALEKAGFGLSPEDKRQILNENFDTFKNRIIETIAETRDKVWSNSETIIEDNFSGTLAKWDIAGAIGTWIISGGALKGTGISGGWDSFLFHNTTTIPKLPKNFVLTCKIKSNGNTMIVFGATDKNNLYAVRIINNYAYIYKRLNGAFNWYSMAYIPGLYNINDWVNVEIVVCDKWISLKTNNKQVATLYDPAYNKGKVGFLVSSTTVIQIDNYKIYGDWEAA